MVRVFTRNFSAFALACASLAPLHAQSAPAVAIPDPVKVADYKALQKLDQRLANIGYRLQKTATPWCTQTDYQMGWVLADRLQYPESDQSAVARSYGTSWPGANDIVIAAVARNSPASRVQFHVGEAVLSIDDIDPSALFNNNNSPKKKKPNKKGNSYDRMAMLEAAMAERFADGHAEVRVQSPTRPTQGLMVSATIPVQLERVCASLISLHVGSNLTAGADGRRVRINHSLALYTKDDNELAWVVAHELAHNILGHPQRLDKAKVNRGLFQQFGKSAKLTRQTEDEADRLSIWLMAKAGYDPAAAVQFWQRYGPEHDSPLIRAATHSSWKDRITTLQAETEVAVATLKADPNARPPVLTASKGIK